MAIRSNIGAELSPREREQQKHEKDMYQLQADHSLELKKLEYEIVKLDTKFSNWIKIPLTLVKLPLLILLGMGFIIGSFREDYEPGQSFWDLLK